MPLQSENEQISRKYFSKVVDSEGSWVCKCGKKLTQKKGIGWTNLMNHIKNQHPEYCKTQEQQSLSNFGFLSLTSASSIDRSALNVFGWIERIYVGLKPFSFTKDPLTCKYTNLKNITNKTLKKYMEKLTRQVEKKIT